MKMRKETYDYETKARAREIFRKFIKKHFGYGNKNLRVACFPGEEALEIYNVYDKLNIPRENIMGIERDRKIYDKLRKQNLGINLFHGTDLEFFQQTNDKFDVVSLDYQGLIKQDGLRMLVKNQHLKERAILLTNFLGRRESTLEQNALWLAERAKFIRESTIYEDKKNLLKRDNYENFIDSQFEILKLPEHLKKYRKERWLKYFNSMCGFLYNTKSPKRREKLSEMRDDSITQLTISTLLHGKFPAELNEIYLRNPNFNDVNKILFEFIENDEFFKSHFSKESKDVILNSFLSQTIHKEALKLYLHDYGYPPAFGHIAAAKTSYGYFCEDIKRYLYNSDDSSPMYLDLFLLNQFREIIDKYTESIDTIYKKKTSPIEPLSIILRRAKAPEDFDEELITLFQDIYKFDLSFRLATGFELPQRLFLGSSYKPKADREEVAKMLVAGASDEEIKEKFRIKTMELAGFKAAYSRGNYDDLKPKEKEEPKIIVPAAQVIEPNKFEIEEQMKERLINIYQDVLLELPEEEIINKYNLKKMELAGYKAAIKRGDKKEIVKEAKERIFIIDKTTAINQVLKNSSKYGIFYLSGNGFKANTDIDYFKSIGYNVVSVNGKNNKEQLIQNEYGLYIINNTEENFKFVEDISLFGSEKFFVPSMLTFGNSILKDRLHELSSVNKELGLCTRLFFHDSIGQLYPHYKDLETILNNTTLIS